jgi:hypothetical protein
MSEEIIRPWFRVPTWCALADDPAEGLAALWLLGRWHVGQAPSVLDLKKRTGWGYDRAARFHDRLYAWAGEHDARRPATSRERTGPRTKKTTGEETGSQRGASGEPAGSVDAPAVVIVEADRGASGEEAGSQPGVSYARVRSSEEREEKRGEENTPLPLGAGLPGPVGPGESVDTPTLVGLARAWPAGAQQAWEAYTAWHPMAGKPGRAAGPNGAAVRVPTDRDRARLRNAVAELGADVVVDLLTWAHVSPHPRARWLCGRVRAGQGPFLGLQSLLDRAKAGERVGFVHAWRAEGRPAVAVAEQGALRPGEVLVEAQARPSPDRAWKGAYGTPDDHYRQLLDGELDSHLTDEGWTPQMIEDAKADARRALRPPLVGLG